VRARRPSIQCSSHVEVISLWPSSSSTMALHWGHLLHLILLRRLLGFRDVDATGSAARVFSRFSSSRAAVILAAAFSASSALCSVALTACHVGSCSLSYALTKAESDRAPGCSELSLIQFPMAGWDLGCVDFRELAIDA